VGAGVLGVGTDGESDADGVGVVDAGAVVATGVASGEVPPQAASTVASTAVSTAVWASRRTPRA